MRSLIPLSNLSRNQGPCCPTAVSRPWDAIGPRRSEQAWLGEAIAIKEPTAAVFRRQTGSNLLIISRENFHGNTLFVERLERISRRGFRGIKQTNHPHKDQVLFIRERILRVKR